MAERGVDISDRPTKSVDRFAGTRFDRVITLCDKVREICVRFPGAPTVAHWSVADPAAAESNDEATYPTFQRVADEIESRVALLLADLTAPAIGRDPAWLTADILNARFVVDDVADRIDLRTCHARPTVGLSSPPFADVTPVNLRLLRLGPQCSAGGWNLIHLVANGVRFRQEVVAGDASGNPIELFQLRPPGERP